MAKRADGNSMSTHIYPQFFKGMWGEAGVKAAFVSEAAPLQPSGCANCGGSGRMITFIAKAGPFKTPSITGINKYHNGAWWQGENFSALCPVCQDEGKITEIKE